MLKATDISAEAAGVCVHSMRATAATNALSGEADIAEVQEWLGHANVSTTRPYDRRKRRQPNDSCEVLGLSIRARLVKRRLVSTNCHALRGLARAGQFRPPDILCNGHFKG